MKHKKTLHKIYEAQATSQCSIALYLRYRYHTYTQKNKNLTIEKMIAKVKLCK